VWWSTARRGCSRTGAWWVWVPGWPAPAFRGQSLQG
jgi:hypothetical protein